MITVIKPNWEWMPLSEWKMDKIVKHLEECGRNCYKSEARITDNSADKFVRKICRNHHLSVLEHECLTARIVCSRACSHQLVRHRIGSYSQASMRYINYDKRGLKVICPPSIGIPPGEYSKWHYYNDLSKRQNEWVNVLDSAYWEYKKALEDKVRPEDARFLLPHATETSVVVTYNMSMWRHVIEERGLNKHAQWEIRDIFYDIYSQLKQRLPAVFEDLE